MYSLLVSSQFQDWDGRGFRFDKSRFLEYTDESIKQQLRSLSNEAIECIRSWPCLLLQEGRSEESVQLVKITDLRDLGKEVGLSVTLIRSIPGIVNNHLWRSREDLGIEQFEFSRNHWSVKERDVISVLRSNGLEIDSSADTSFECRALPAPTRGALLATRNVISAWGHTEIDDFLLEAGVEDLDAGREIGSRRDRANAIVEFAINNPSAVTAENSMFSIFILQKTSPHLSHPQDIIPQFRIQESVPFGVTSTPRAPTGQSPNRVFVVHGQNQIARSAVVSFLEGIGLAGIVLHEQPSMGRHLLTKFIQEADLVTFAVVLMTDDDLGSLKGQELQPRARQNVILELGYFLAHLGQTRVCALITPGLETPSDFDGIVYIRMDKAGAWKQELKRELTAAGMPVT